MAQSMSKYSHSFKQVLLEDAMEAIIDYRGKTPPKTQDGIPLITAKVIKHGRILKEPQEFIAEEFYEEWMTRGLPKINDVLLTTEAPLGEVAAIRTTSKIALAQRVILLRSDPETLDQTFLLYLMQSPLIQSQLRAVASGTTVLGINQKELRKVVLPLPSIEKQLVIGSTLKSIDDLIENNTRRIEILEESAKALYREWFVHYRYPGHENDTMVDSELGPIPKGWEIKPFSSAVSINPKLKTLKNQEYKHFGMSDLSTQLMTCSNSEVKRVNSGSKFQNNDVLFARITPCLENGKTGYVNSLQDGEIGRGSTEFIVLRAKEISSFMVYAISRDNEFRSHAKKSMVGASGRQRVQNACFDDYLISVPPKRLIQQFGAPIGPMFHLIRDLDSQNQKLSISRDLLLPRLISGELDVSDLDLVA